MALASRWALLEGFLPESCQSLLDSYVSELIRWNNAIRLIGPKDEAGAVVQVIDSLLPFRYAPCEYPLLDIGSGAGLPAIPLAIMNPEMEIVCMDPDTKRASFLRHAGRLLKLASLKVVCDKAENAYKEDPSLEGMFRTVTARAVTRVDTLLRWSAPYLAKDGKIVLGRGADNFELPVGWVLEKHLTYPGHSQAGERSVAVFSRENE